MSSVETLQREVGVPPSSATEGGRRFFLERVCAVEGAQVRVSGTGSLVDKRIVVIVPSLRGPVADQVFDLEIQAYRRFPGARLSIEITDAAWIVD